MPAWAEANPLVFWQTADTSERQKGTTYREMEIALPRELTGEQRADLMRAFIAQEIGDRHAFQWAIHVPTASDGGEQPHAHLMFSERQRDGIERGPEQYFKRYNAKVPEKGGARKGYGASAGEKLSRSERAAELKALRERWELMANQHLERAGHTDRIDMRSYRDRGSDMMPEPKQLPSQWRDDATRSNVIAFRQARAAEIEAGDALDRDVPDFEAEIISLTAARLAREKGNQAAPEIADSTTRPSAQPRVRLLDVARSTAAPSTPSTGTALPPSSPPTSQIVLTRWTAEQQRQLEAVQAKARRVDRYARELRARHQRLQEGHQQAKPPEPTGLLATFRKAAHEAWEQARIAIERRIRRLSQHIDRIGEYLAEGSAFNQRGSLGDQLAMKKAQEAEPELAAEAARIMEQQRRAELERVEHARRDVGRDGANRGGPKR